jgi:hypothetical protein
MTDDYDFYSSLSSHEFKSIFCESYNGRLYDSIRICSNDKSIIFSCTKDNENDRNYTKKYFGNCLILKKTKDIDIVVDPYTVFRNLVGKYLVKMEIYYKENYPVTFKFTQNGGVIHTVCILLTTKINEKVANPLERMDKLDYDNLLKTIKDIREGDTITINKYGVYTGNKDGESSQVDTQSSDDEF